jgi:rod shape-determining protein MreB
MRNPLKAGWSGLGIDLGTVNTLICDQNARVLLNEPSVVTINRNTSEIEAVGHEARRMLGRTPRDLEVIFPLRDGVINSFDLTRDMLMRFLQKIDSVPRFMGTRLVICVPTETTQIERRAVRQIGSALKASETFVVEEPIAGAYGAGFPVDAPRGSMIVDVGGGTTEIAVISLGSIVCSGSVRVGGTHMDEAIVMHVRRKHHMLIGSATAERLKVELGSAQSPGKGTAALQVKGHDLISRLPKIMSLSSHDVYEAIENFVRQIMGAIRRTLERTPPELAADISESGITLTGGGTLLPGLAERIEKEVHVPVAQVADPLLCVAIGAARLLSRSELLSRVQLRNL